MLSPQVDLSLCLIATAQGPAPEPLLASLFATADPVLVEAVVLANGQEPPYLARLDRLFPQTKFILSRPGLPPVRALNACLCHATGRYLALLPANAVVQPDCLLNLVGYLDDHPICGAAAPQCISPTGNAGSPGRRFPTLLSFLRKFTGLGGAAEPQPHAWETSPRHAFWIPADTVVFRRETLLETGLFDERFHFFYHDADLCRRILRAGWHLGVAADSRILRPAPGGRPAVLDPVPAYAASPLPTSPLQLLDGARFLLHRAANRSPLASNLQMEPVTAVFD